MAFAQRGLPDTFGATGGTLPRPTTRAFVSSQTPTRAAGFARSVGRLSSPPTVTVSAAPVLAERVGSFVPPPQVPFDKKVRLLPPLSVSGWF